ncbi:MAG: hypothetical protein DMG30_11990 [Acidobacteria bacterium]|nr:MAG: hypothetical protein DMG30_11990 [Acidobacteriota bacterium]
MSTTFLERILEFLDRKYPLEGNMNFLKKLGTIAVKIVDAITNMNLLPLVSKIVPVSLTKTFDRLLSAFHTIITAEQMWAAAYGADAKMGSDKLKAATPFVAALVHDVMNELKPGAKPKDEAKFEAACTAMTSAMADALSSYDH